MLRSPFKREPTALEAVITDVYTLMQREEPSSDEYELLLTKAERLEKLRNDNPRSSKQISPDTLVTVGGHLVMVLVMVAYEERHVITSKALGFIQKLV